MTDDRVAILLSGPSRMEDEKNKLGRSVTNALEETLPSDRRVALARILPPHGD